MDYGNWVMYQNISKNSGTCMISESVESNTSLMIWKASFARKKTGLLGENQYSQSKLNIPIFK